jgi:hypothetical protein
METKVSRVNVGHWCLCSSKKWCLCSSKNRGTVVMDVASMKTVLRDVVHTLH